MDEEMMAHALVAARAAAEAGEVPVGAVAVFEGSVIAAAGNVREARRDPTAHAEMLVLREAAERLSSWRLSGVTVYVTLEPCAMCAGAMVQARIQRLVFGASDSKTGAAGSLYDIARDPRHNHQLEVTSGVLAVECGDVLTDFFARLREMR